MASSENPEIQVDESQIEEEQHSSRNHTIKRPRKKTDSKKKKIARKQELKKPIDGKQQFGDKAICRLCKKTTQQTAQGGTLICNRCHFKYHKDCIKGQEKEPQWKEGEKWKCASCIERLQKKNLKDQAPQKKKKPNQIQEYFKNPKHLQEDKAKKLQEFQQKYPTYINCGSIVFPIFDEYLTAYHGLFGVELKKKPVPKNDLKIPQDLFEDTLKIWDSYNNMDKIVSDILYLDSQEQQSQLSNIGTLIHFKDNHRPYSQKNREEIFELINNKPEELILFFSYFYLKQIIEDYDMEQMQKIQYKTPFWHLMGYLWFTNRQMYYALLNKNVFQLPQYIHKQGLLKSQTSIDITEVKSNMKLILILVEGLEDLKKTQFFYQFRTENLLSNNRIKTQLGVQIKTLRSQLCDKQREKVETETEYYTQKDALVKDGLTRQESAKLTKMMEQSQKNLQKLKSGITKDEREINSLTERYNQLEQDLSIIQMPQLLQNASMFLGFDYKNCQYYYFLYEPDRIFICYKESILDEQTDMKWGYYEMEDILSLVNNLCVKGVRENNLKINIQDLLRTKLLTSKVVQKQEMDEEKQINNNEEKENEIDNNKQEVLQEQDNDIEQEQQEIKIQELEYDLDSLRQEFQFIEQSLSEYLNQKNSRWCNSDTRNNFKRQLTSDDINEICSIIDYFVENTMMQEKLELRLDEDYEEKQPIEIDDDSNQSPINHINNRKRKVVEDDSSSDEPKQPQTLTPLQQLEQMEANKVRVRKLPMKLFGTYFEQLRLNLLDQLRAECDINQLKIVLEVLGQIVKDYIDRKKNQILMPVGEKKKQIQEEVIIPKKEKIMEPQLQHVQVEQKHKMNIRTRTRPKPQYTEIENRWEDVCKECGQGGKVICCDTCPRVFHPKCINLKEVPQGKWNCLHCLSNFERQVKTRATIKKLENQ